MNNRRLTPELMDDPNVPRDELERSLRFLRALNARLGGVSALLSHLQVWSSRWPRDRPVTLLDIATGSADIPIAARAWAERAGFDLRITAVDMHEKTLEIAREQVERAGAADAIELRQADARRLMDEHEPHSFDYVHAGLFLHHLPDIEVLTVLRIMDRLAGAGLVWSDLVRSRLSMLGARIATIRAPQIVKHDAVVSVEAGFTKAEVLDLRNRLDLTWCEYRRSPLRYRFTLAGERPDAWTD
ncbi:MAG: methyltransferase domain-containing protein [Phycisphaeraceae bacterium]|nr:MAG: methyltransferase domain-containing protein [Phycisphaeraceae bacterium]